MVTTFYPPYHFGGDATYVRALSRGLVAKGHEVEVVHCEDSYRLTSKDNKPEKGYVDDGVIVHRLKNSLGFLSPLITQQTGRPGIKSLAIKKILDKKFDVVNFHNISLIGGPAILKLSHAPVTLYTLHEHWLLCPTHIFWKNKTKVCDQQTCVTCSIRSGIPPQIWRYGSLIEESLKSVDSLIAPSNFSAKKHSSAGIKAPIKVMDLFSAVSPGEKVPYRASERSTFLFVGRVTASKGIISLLKTFAKHQEYDLIVAGDGDLLDCLKKEYMYCSNINFLGSIEQQELIELYQNATALIFPSLAPEVFGLTIVEAFACGTPAVVNESCGSGEIIEKTGGGMVYNTESELTRAISSLANNLTLRQELGEKALQGFNKFYKEEIHLDHYLKLINDIKVSKSGVIPKP
ncbi:MAG: glycosyltransferase family 4 protein [Nitrospinales bacterium]